MDLGVRHVMQMTFGAWQSAVLYALVELDVFTTLADGPLTATEVAARHGLEPVTTASLLDAGVALRLLHKQEENYTNSAPAGKLLTGGSDESLVEWVRMMSAWSRAFAHLPEVVRTGEPARGADLRFTDDADYVADQGLGLFRYATRFADELAACVTSPLTGVMVDAGGGFGAYSLALCRRFPQLRSEIWELSEVVPQARKVIADRGLAERVQVMARDYTTEEFGSGLAAILLSNVLHQERRDTAAGMLRRAYRALAPGGTLIVNTSCLQDDRTGPLFATLHNLSATVLWRGGRDFTEAEITKMIMDAGFREPRVSPIAGGASTVLTATTGPAA